MTINKSSILNHCCNASSKIREPTYSTRVNYYLNEWFPGKSPFVGIFMSRSGTRHLFLFYTNSLCQVQFPFESLANYVNLKTNSYTRCIVVYVSKNTMRSNKSYLDGIHKDVYEIWFSFKLYSRHSSSVKDDIVWPSTNDHEIHLYWGNRWFKPFIYYTVVTMTSMYYMSSDWYFSKLIALNSESGLKGFKYTCTL